MIAARIASIALLTLALGACDRDESASSHRSEISMPLRSGEDPRFDRAAADLRACVDLVLYEGLPHGMFERDLCESELRAKSTVRRHGELFYAAPIPITAADADALRATFGEADNYFARDATGMSLCGGFHADYALTWSSSAGEYELHVCFRCYEANLYSPAGLVPFGMRGTHYRSSPPRDTLHPFRVQRPAREW